VAGREKGLNPGSSDVVCMSCGEKNGTLFYELMGIPVHSVLLMPKMDIAINYPRGDIKLSFCRSCGFISNVAFDPGKHEYSSKYEETQGFSNTFNTFSRRLAMDLIERFDLRNKDIIEIGCGKGEFLTLLCELGDNRGIGFDPAYIKERDHSLIKDRVTFIKDFYSVKYTGYSGDFICCKMTLEHIQKTSEFVSTIRGSLRDRPDTVVFFQVPDASRILEELAFWDIYYEHCSYFTCGSLARLFRACGFDIIDLWRDFDDQYIMIAARLGGGKVINSFKCEENIEDLSKTVESFATAQVDGLRSWKERLRNNKEKGLRTVLWGGGSKAVAFLTTLNIVDEIEYVVDINPYKHGTFMAGSGQEIVAPAFLKTYRPDVVIVMNPVYHAEIGEECRIMGLSSEIRNISGNGKS
jgi:hypothetical protein